MALKSRTEYLRARARIEGMLLSSNPRSSRRALIATGGKVAVGGGLALAMAGAGGWTIRPAAAQDDEEDEEEAEAPFADDLEVLNYALTLEHIEATFYRVGGEAFTAADYVAIGFQAQVRDYIAEIGSNEADHVATLTTVIDDLGGDPVAEAEYEFPYTDLTSYLAFALALEDTGVDAYTGAAQYIQDPDLLTAALTIHGNEARHAAYLALLNQASPFPDAFDAPLTPAEVLEIAGPLIVS